jgi:hypothetical protein
LEIELILYSFPTLGVLFFSLKKQIKIEIKIFCQIASLLILNNLLSDELNIDLLYFP